MSRFCRSLLNTYQGKRAFRPPLQRFNDIEERMIGKRGGRVRFNLRSMRPNSFMNVYSTAGQKQRRSDPSLIHFEEGEYDGGVADNVVEEEFEEPNQVRKNANFAMEKSALTDPKASDTSTALSVALLVTWCVPKRCRKHSFKCGS